MHRRLDVDRLPERRTVVRIDFTGARQKSFWLVLERPTVSVCWTDPGFDVDLQVSADTLALHRVWAGQLDLRLALREGLIMLAGPADLCRAFPESLKLSIFTERGVGAEAHQPRADSSEHRHAARDESVRRQDGKND
jgi:hypothetical protein